MEIPQYGRRTTLFLTLCYAGINTGLLVLASSIVTQAKQLAPGVIGMTQPESDFRSLPGYEDIDTAHAARVLVERLCVEIGFWAPISFTLLLLFVWFCFFGWTNPYKISKVRISDLIFLFMGAGTAFLAMVYYIAALAILPKLLFESY